MSRETAWDADDKFIMRDGVQIGSFITAELAVCAVDGHNQQIKLAEALKSVIAGHCPNDKLFCGSCSPARELLKEVERVD